MIAIKQRENGSNWKYERDGDDDGRSGEKDVSSVWKIGVGGE